MKAATAIIAILILVLVSVTATGAAWVSMQSMFINGDATETNIILDSIECKNGVIRGEVFNPNEEPITEEIFISANLKKTTNDYEAVCHSECLKLEKPLQKNEKTVFFEWGCEDGCSSGAYIVSFKTKYQTIETIVNC